MKFRRGLLRHGIISGDTQGDGNNAVGVGGIADRLAVGVQDLEHSPLQRGFGPGFQLGDFQLRDAGVGRIVRLIRLVRVSGILADGAGLDGVAGVGVQKVVLDVAVLVLLQGLGVVDYVLVHHAAHVQCDGAGLALHAGGGVDHLAGVVKTVVAVGVQDKRGYFLVVLIQNLGPGGSALPQGELYGLNGPGLASDGKFLLIVSLAVDGDRVRLVPVRRGGELGGVHLVPHHAPPVDVLGGLEDALRRLTVGPGQVGIDTQLVDGPVAQDMNPDSGLGGVVALVDRLEAQGFQGLVGVAVGNDAHQLVVGHGFLGAVLYGRSLGHLDRNTVQLGVHAVGGNLFDLPGLHGFILIISIVLLLDAAVHGQPIEGFVLGIHVHLSHGLLQSVGGKGGYGQDAQQGNESQEEGNHTFFQNKVPP